MATNSQANYNWISLQCARMEGFISSTSSSLTRISAKQKSLEIKDNLNSVESQINNLNNNLNNSKDPNCISDSDFNTLLGEIVNMNSKLTTLQSNLTNIKIDNNNLTLGLQDAEKSKSELSSSITIVCNNTQPINDQDLMQRIFDLALFKDQTFNPKSKELARTVLNLDEDCKNLKKDVDNFDKDLNALLQDINNFIIPYDCYGTTSPNLFNLKELINNIFIP